MATISGYDSSSLGVLFSSLNTKNTNNSGNAMSDLLGINYSDYATIRSGSYFRLMKAYYSTGSSEMEQAISSTSTSKDDAKTLARIESDAEDMKKAADALLEKGSKSLFKTKEVTDESGKVSKQYNTDEILKAVKKFADEYNSMLDEASESETANISAAADRLVQITKTNEKLLGKIGITVDENDHLKIDEEAFKKADMTVVKGLFNETGSYGYQVSARANMIHYYAENEASKSNTYGKSGEYTYNYNTGTMYNEGI